MSSRLHTALGLLLALALVALVTASGSLLGSSEHFLGTASASLLDDDNGDGVVAVVPQPLLVGFLCALALVALAIASPSGAGVSKPRRARAPPSR